MRHISRELLRLIMSKGRGGGCTPLFGPDRYVTLGKVWFLGTCGVFNRGSFYMEVFNLRVWTLQMRGLPAIVAPTFFSKKISSSILVLKIALFYMHNETNQGHKKVSCLVFLSTLPSPGLSYSALISVSFPCFFFLLPFPCPLSCAKTKLNSD